MRLTTEERAFVQQVAAEANRLALLPDGSIDVRAVPHHFLRLLREAEGLNPTFVGAYIDHLAVKGAGRALAEKRRKRTKAKTAKGTDLSVPATAGIRRPDHNGRKIPVQVPLEGMTVPELRSYRARMAASRNTLSRDIRHVDDVIALCEERGYATAEQALADLRAA